LFFCRWCAAASRVTLEGVARDRKLEGLVYALTGGLSLYQAAKCFGVLPNGPVSGLGRSRGRGLGYARGPEAEAMLNAGGIIDRVDNHTVANVEERVSYIQKQIREDSAKPLIRERAMAVLTRRVQGPNGVQWAIGEKDYEAEVIALFTAVRDAGSATGLRYTRDHLTIDQFHSAEKLLQLKGGDCDDGCILLGSMLRSVGFPIRLRVIQDNKSDTWSHIYILVGLPPTNPTKWVPLDWSMPEKPPGWEAPGAARTAVTGKPSGVVTRVADFTV
jgi:hypothetical protein